MHAKITLPSLKDLSVSGVADVNVLDLDADDITLSLAGVAELDISGSCVSLTGDVSGVGELDAKNFECKKANITMSGVGEVSVYASEEIDVTASGVGGVVVYGKPENVDTTKSLMSSIRFK